MTIQSRINGKDLSPTPTATIQWIVEEEMMRLEVNDGVISATAFLAEIQSHLAQG